MWKPLRPGLTGAPCCALAASIADGTARPADPRFGNRAFVRRLTAILVLVALSLASFGLDAKAHEGTHGATTPMDRSLIASDAEGEECPAGHRAGLDCCFACLAAGFPAPTNSVPGIDFLTAPAYARPDETVADGLRRAPPNRPPISA